MLCICLPLIVYGGGADSIMNRDYPFRATCRIAAMAVRCFIAATAKVKWRASQQRGAGTIISSLKAESMVLYKDGESDACCKLQH